MHPVKEAILNETRRQFFGQVAKGIGGLALSNLMAEELFAQPQDTQAFGGLPTLPHFAPKATRCIYLHMMGAPPQMDLLDYKPQMQGWYDKDLPESIRKGQRLTTMTSGQARFPIAPSIFKFDQHGRSGAWISELLPHTAKMVDDLAIVRSMHTEAINHDPAITYIQTGSQVPGRPSLGAWLSYGLGRVNENLPGYVVMHARSKFPEQSLFNRLWGTGFMPSEHQGVLLRSEGDPVLYLKNPAGVTGRDRRAQLDTLAAINLAHYKQFADPEILARIQQHELAYRMQTSVPELMDLTGESDATFELYGEEAKSAGSFAACCLNARRLAERGVRNIQIFHRGWDAHGSLPKEHESQCKDIDQASAALITDLKQRGMLDETLVVWGGEFGRTAYCQGKLTETNYGRDHHPRCFTTWMAGGGIKPGITYGRTDDYAYNITDADGNMIRPTKDKWTAGTMHIHDLNATILNQLGIDHRKLTYRYQGRDFRLTDVHGHVIKDLIA